MSSIPNLNLGGDSDDDDMSDEEMHYNKNNSNLDESNRSKAPVLLFQNDDEEDEDVDEPNNILPIESQPIVPMITASDDFNDAWQAVQSNPNDVISWKIYVGEIRNGRHGHISIHDAYKPFFMMFPRAYMIYWDYLSSCLEMQLYHDAEEIFQKTLYKARNPHLWVLYTSYLRSVKHNLDIIGRSYDDYHSDRKAIEMAYEQAIENVGSSYHSYPIWREYIDFVKSWPETGVYSDMNKKLLMLRKVYQRAVCVPIENLDVIWKEYEALERQAGEHLAEKVLPEYQEKYLHAKTIYAERRRYTADIDLYRLATPPMRDLLEVQQLQLWNKWIKFELSNPDNLTSKALHDMIRMIYDQCLSCYTKHAEIWISLASYEDETSGLIEARHIYRDAIEMISSSALLRLSYAELEEKYHHDDEVHDIIRSSFMIIPSSFTFAVYQRYVRRKEGKVSARRLYSDTIAMRQNDKKLAFEITLAHAQLELDTNAEPEVANNILTLAESYYTSPYPHIHSIHLHIRCYMRLNKLSCIQHLLSHHIQTLSYMISSYHTISSSSENQPGVTIISSSSIDEMKKMISDDDFNISSALRDQLYLLEEYLHIEMMIGLSSHQHIMSIKHQRDAVKSSYDDHILSQQKKSTSSSYMMNISVDDIYERSYGSGIYKHPYELSERYHHIASSSSSSSSSLPIIDDMMRERSCGKKLVDTLTRQDIERKMNKHHHKRSSSSSSSSSYDNGADMINVPYILRELLVHLPSHSGPTPDIDLCLRQMKNIILPPRPSSSSSSSSYDDISGIEYPSSSSSLHKRGRDDQHHHTIGEDWLTAASGIDEVEEELLGKPDVDNINAKADIFRERQRARLLL